MENVTISWFIWRGAKTCFQVEDQKLY